jgi:Zn ribbon nucleic-acid-binding protein
MKIETLVACPDCMSQCSIDFNRKRGTVIIDCPDCGIDRLVPDYDESVVLSNGE